MMKDGNYTYHGEQCIMYRIVDSLFCAPETNIALCVSSTSKKKKKSSPLQKKKKQYSLNRKIFIAILLSSSSIFLKILS